VIVSHRIHRFLHTDADDDYAYWRSLAALWVSTDTLVNVEHDHPFSEALVSELLSCPHPLCTHAYLMHVPRMHYAHSTRADAMDGFWISEGDEWAAYSAIGFCKIAASARVRPLARTVWRGVELEVNSAATGSWHVHWGVDGHGIEHYHY
jgi:hypothetical protein